MMNRLTKAYDSGKVTLDAEHFKPLVQEAIDAEISASVTLLKTVARRLYEYENAEEGGLLVRLPCKVGDTVYVIYRDYVASARVLAVYIDNVGGMFDLKIQTNIENSVGFETIINKDDYCFDDFGKTVFLTPEKAEQALKERENDRNV